MWFNVLAIISCLIMQYLSTVTLCLGKFLHGVFITVVHISQIKMINETVPVNLLGKYGAIVQQGTALGYFLVLGFGLGLPQADYNPGLSDDPGNLAAK